MATARRSGDGGSGEGRDRQRDGGRRRSRDSGDGAGSPPDLRERPVDLAAERGVLGSIFLKPDACDDVALVLRPEDFADLPVWRGLRPCSPDGLPYLGRFGRYANLTAATGHAMMGLSLAPITGQLVAQVVSGEPPALPLALLHPDRYP